MTSGAILSRHARERMAERGIDPALLDAGLARIRRPDRLRNVRATIRVAGATAVVYWPLVLSCW